MKVGCVICGPDVAYGPLALLSGSFAEKVSRAAALGYDGIELMVRDPAPGLAPGQAYTQRRETCSAPSSHRRALRRRRPLFGYAQSPDLYRRALARTQAVIDLAADSPAIVNIGRLRGRLDSVRALTAVPWASPSNASQPLRTMPSNRGCASRWSPSTVTRPISSPNSTTCACARCGQTRSRAYARPLRHEHRRRLHRRGFRQAGDRLWDVHIADSNRLYPGAGHLDFTSIFATLAAMGYTGYVSAEILPKT